MKIRLLGFRSKKTWKMILAGFTYALILMVVVIGIINPTSEEASSKTETEKVVEVAKPIETKEKVEVVAPEVDKENEEKEYYINNTKIEVDRINSEFDNIWDENWKPAWDSASNGDTSNIGNQMEMIVERYDTLYTSITNIPTDQLTKGKQNIEEYKLNLGKAILYRKNAAQAILQAVNGTASFESRTEEAIKSVELSDEYLLNGVAEVVQLELDFGIER